MFFRLIVELFEISAVARAQAVEEHRRWKAATDRLQRDIENEVWRPTIDLPKSEYHEVSSQGHR